jgi:hypothetical protein
MGWLTPLYFPVASNADVSRDGYSVSEGRRHRPRVSARRRDVQSGARLRQPLYRDAVGPDTVSCTPHHTTIVVPLTFGNRTVKPKWTERHPVGFLLRLQPQVSASNLYDSGETIAECERTRWVTLWYSYVPSHSTPSMAHSTAASNRGQTVRSLSTSAPSARSMQEPSHSLVSRDTQSSKLRSDPY